MSVGTEENVLKLFMHHAYIIYMYIYYLSIRVWVPR